jgi:RHS repeat-associated protein
MNTYCRSASLFHASAFIIRPLLARLRPQPFIYLCGLLLAFPASAVVNENDGWRTTLYTESKDFELGGTIPYVLKVERIGPALTNVLFRDVRPFTSYTLGYENVTPAPDEGGDANWFVGWHVDRMEPGDSFTARYEVRLTANPFILQPGARIPSYAFAEGEEEVSADRMVLASPQLNDQQPPPRASLDFHTQYGGREGSSANNPNTLLAEDPVSTATGEFVLDRPVTAFDLGGPLPLRLDYWYASALNDPGIDIIRSALGRDWMHTFEATALANTSVNPSSLRVVLPGGKIISFTKIWPSETWVLNFEQEGIAYQLQYDGLHYWVLDPASDRLYRFSGPVLANTPAFGHNGLLLEIQDRNHNSLLLSHRADGRVTNVTDTLGRQLDFAYNTSSNLVSVTDGTRSVQFAHNAQGAITNATDVAGFATAYTYDPVHSHTNGQGALLTSIRHPRGNTPVSQTYNAAGQVISQTDAFAAVTAFTYDSGTGLTEVQGPLGSMTHTYANYRRATHAADQAGNVLQLEYDDMRDLVTRRTDRRGKATTIDYDLNTREPVRIVHPDGGTTLYHYVTTTQIFTNRVTGTNVATFAFRDLAGITHPDGTTELWHRDVHGNITQRVDRTGAAWNTAYNARGQVTVVSRPGGGADLFSYNADGTLASRGSSDTGMTSHTYDALRRRVGTQFPDGTAHMWGLNARDQITALTNTAGGVAVFTHDANGAMTESVDAAGHVVIRGFDAMNRLTNRASPTGWFEVTQFDAGGRLVAEVRPARTNLYQHDGRGWITNMNLSGRSSTWHYDAEGNVTNTISPLGHAVATTYDAMNRPVQIRNPLGHVTAYEYDRAGRMSRLTDPLGHATEFQYDGEGRLTNRVHAAQPLHPETFAYDASGKLVGRTDADGNETTFTYTLMGRPVLTIDALGQTNRLVYDGAGRLIRREFADGTEELLTYDPAGRLQTRTDEASNVWSFAHHSRGDLLFTTNPVGGVTAYAYTSDGLLQTVGDSDTGIWSNRYDAARRLVETVQPDGFSVQFEYSAHDEIIGTINPLGHRHSREYDADGRLTRVTDERGYHTDFGYDAAGRRTHLVHSSLPDDPATMVYDAAGRVIAEIDPSLVSLAYGYDALGRITNRALGSSAWGYTHNASGHVVAETTPSGRVTTYARDALHRVTHTVDPLHQTNAVAYDMRGRVIARTDAEGRVTQFGHDAVGRLTSVTLPDDSVTAYEYDALGTLAQLTDASGNVWVFTNSPMGRPLSLTDPLERTTRRSYDLFGRLQEVVYPDDVVQTIRMDAAGQPTNVVFAGAGAMSIAYTYDEAGHVVQADEILFTRDPFGRIAGLRDGGVDFGATYDPAGRLASVTYADGALTVTYQYATGENGTGLLTNLYDQLTGTAIAFAYDEDLRLVSTMLPNGETIQRTWDDADRLARIQSGAHVDVELSRDAAGRITQTRLTAPLTSTNALILSRTDTFTTDAAAQIDSEGFAYDVRGRLIESPAGTFAYDAASRVAAHTHTVSAVLTYDAYGNVATREQGGDMIRYYHHHAIATAPLVAERDGEDGPYLRYYIWTPAGELLYMIDAANDNSVYFYHFDPVGSTLALTDTNGLVTDAWAYDPHGLILARSGSNPQPFTYVGQRGVRQENASGLYQMRARWYDATLARFLTPEPIWPQLDDPIQINPYQYAGNEPVRLSDPSGLSVFTDGLSRLDVHDRAWWNDQNSAHFRQWQQDPPPPIHPSQRGGAGGNGFPTGNHEQQAAVERAGEQAAVKVNLAGNISDQDMSRHLRELAERAMRAQDPEEYERVKGMLQPERPVAMVVDLAGLRAPEEIMSEAEYWDNRAGMILLGMSMAYDHWLQSEDFESRQEAWEALSAGFEQGFGPAWLHLNDLHGTHVPEQHLPDRR